MKKFWAGVFAVLILGPIAIALLLLGLANLPSLHMTKDDLWGLLIFGAFFLFVGLLVEGISSS